MNSIRQIMTGSFLASLSVIAFADDGATDAFTVNAAAVGAVTATPTVVAEQKRDNTVLISPRTGMRYVVNNPNNVPIVFQTEALAPVTTENVQRIAANNPALSEASQQQAQQALLQLEAEKQQASNQ